METAVGNDSPVNSPVTKVAAVMREGAAAIEDVDQYLLSGE